MYYQIAIDIKKRISAKEWITSERIPSETELSEYYGVSRITLRQALAELEKDGVIIKIRGKGVYISENPIPHIYDLSYPISLSTSLREKGIQFSSDVLELIEFPDPLEDVCEKLRLRPDEPVVYIKRLFIADKRPICVSESWIPAHLVPNLAMEGLIDGMISKTFAERYHLDYESIEDCFEVLRPTKNLVELLKITYDTPILLLTGISYTEDKNPLEYSQTSWSADSVRFRFNISRKKSRVEIIM